MQPQCVILIWIFTLGQCLTSMLASPRVDKVIVVNQNGTSDLKCCVYGNCLCSNLSLALEQIKGNTEIKINSSASLHSAVLFGNVSSVAIIGDNNPTVMCDHQGDLVGKNIKHIVIQGITWDSCNGITLLSFTNVHFIKCNFQNFSYFALTLHGQKSVVINESTFSHNNGSINALAPSITIHGSSFYGDSKIGALVINTASVSASGSLALQTKINDINIIITSCEFSGISGHCVHCIGRTGLPLPKLSVVSSNFTNNTNTAVNVEYCNITLSSVTFYNNSIYSEMINDGAAIRIYNGTVNMSGTGLFYHNRAGNNGGAIYLNHSDLFTSQGSILSFHNNRASNGGAVYIGEGSRLIRNTASIKFLDNYATSNGRAIYVDLYYIKDANVIYDLETQLLENITYKCDDSCVYFKTPFLSKCFPIKGENINARFIAVSSSPCSISESRDKISTVTVNFTDNDITSGFLRFWLHDLHLAVTIADSFGNPMGPLNASFWCCGDLTLYNCTIDSHWNSFTVTSNNTIIECPSSDILTCNIIYKQLLGSPDIYVTVRNLQCNSDIVHAIKPHSGWCLPICNTYLSSQKGCVKKDFLPGYWYDNGFRRFSTSCPIGHCNPEFYSNLKYLISIMKFPNRNIQCKDHWGGVVCGACNYSDNYAIIYDTTKCVDEEKCLTTSVTGSLLILFGVSFLYWIIIISIIFVLLHFKFDITAGYAYGLLFYYGMLEQVVNDVTNYLVLDKRSYDIFDEEFYFFDETYDDRYEFMRFNILPFLSSIGNLKPPITRFMKLCLHNTEMIDHLLIGYIHPLIVIFLVFAIFVLARNYVSVARTIGKYVNSRSICILLLLSYSSITYTSMQLLKPLPIFETFRINSSIRVYWSPTVKYFHGRHMFYAIIAILCELIIGIGLPLIIIFQKHLIHYCNINFMSIKPVVDQLMGCYKEEYRWFAAYYLICRQVLYGVNDLVDYGSGFWVTRPMLNITPFSKFVIILTTCIFIMVVHVWYQPYKRKGLNILDGNILITLVGLLASALEYYWDKAITVVFWFLPLIILINYLAYSTKLKYFTIPCSCIAVFCATLFFTAYIGFFAILFLSSSFIILVVYIIYVIKILCTRCCKTRPQYIAINQNDELDEDSDSIIEVSMYSCVAIFLTTMYIAMCMYN